MPFSIEVQDRLLSCGSLGLKNPSFFGMQNNFSRIKAFRKINRLIYMPDVSNNFSDSWLHFICYQNLLSWEFTVYSKAKKHPASPHSQRLAAFCDSSNTYCPRWSLPRVSYKTLGKELSVDENPSPTIFYL